MKLYRTDPDYNTLMQYLTVIEEKASTAAMVGVAKGISDTIKLGDHQGTLNAAKGYYNSKLALKVIKKIYLINDQAPVKIDLIKDLVNKLYLFKASVVYGFSDIKVVETEAGVADMFNWSFLFSEDITEVICNNVKMINEVAKLTKDLLMSSSNSSVPLG